MKGPRFITAAAAALVLGAALPAVASATDYCVAPNTSCGENNVDDLQAALDKASAGNDADRVLLGVGTYVASLTGFEYNTQTAPVEIVGAGRDRTVLTGPPGAIDHVFDLYGPAGTSMHDLEIRIPKQVGGPFVALDVRADLARIDVVENPDQSNYRTGVRLTAPSALEDARITLGDPYTRGVAMRGPALASPPNVVRGSAVSATRAVESQGGGRVERSNLAGQYFGVYAIGGVTDVSSSLIRFTDPGGAGVLADAGPPGTTANVNGATIVGPAAPSGSAISAGTFNNAAENATVNVTNSILRAHRAFYASGKGPGVAQISAAFSDYDPSADAATGFGAIHESHVQNAGDARFVNADGGDFRLLPGSPLVDRGDPDVPQGLDLDGNALVADGNGDGFARRDLGAFELQPAAPQPQVQTDTHPPVISAFRARLARLRYTLSENARVTVRIQRRLAGKRARYRSLGKLSATAKQGANRTPVSRRIRRRALRPGRYRAVIVAVDAAGNRSAPKVAAFRVNR